MDEVILSRIRKEAYEQGYQDGKVDGYNLAGARMSSAKQERKRGKWIDYPIADGCLQCSVCGILRFEESNFCPNCGADTRGEEDAEVH